METIGFPLVTTGLFIALSLSMLTFDVMSHNHRGVVSLKSASMWSVGYIGAAMLFALHLYSSYGKEVASLFITGYTLEKVLAFDNLFVFSLIFTYFKIPQKDRHAALHWGIMGAVVFRLIFVVLGVGSMAIFGPVMEFIFACLIAYTIYLIIKSGDDSEDYDNAWYVKKIKRRFPTVTTFVIAVCVIEVSDIMFAFDSVPAIIAVTKDPLLIYSSMIFAILGLRSMFFVIDALKSYLRYLEQAIIVVLGFISVKLALHAITGFHIDAMTSLFIILFILTAGIVASFIGGVEHEKQT